jgi:hypothetical protein
MNKLIKEANSLTESRIKEGTHEWVTDDQTRSRRLVKKCTQKKK